MKWRRERVAARRGSARRRVVARTLIAAPRERVWARVYSNRAALLPTGLSGLLRGAERGVRGVALDEQVLAYAPPHRYGYRLSCKLFFRTYAGQILLSEYQRTTTEVSWTIDFEPKVPGSGWLASALLDRILDRALLRLKRELEAVHR